LHIDPKLPSEWSALSMQLEFHGEPVGIRAEHDRVVIDCGAPLIVRVGGADPQSCRPPGHAYTIGDSPRRERRTQ
jgi:hypothetical protein